MSTKTKDPPIKVLKLSSNSLSTILDKIRETTFCGVILNQSILNNGAELQKVAASVSNSPAKIILTREVVVN